MLKNTLWTSKAKAGKGSIMKKLFVITIVLAMLAALCACGPSEPAEKVYLEDSEIDAALSDGDAYKGKYIKIAGKVFNVDTDGDSIALQAWYDPETANHQFIVNVDKEIASEIEIKEDDYVRVDGKIAGTFTGENALGGEISAMIIDAESIEKGGYDDIYAPAESTKEVGETKEQHGVSVTLDRIEYAKGEARVYVMVKNESGYQASIYGYDAKAIQDGKQFDYEDNYEAGYDGGLGDVLDGASKEGILRFRGIDPEKPVKIQIGAYSDNFDIDMEDYVFEVK